MDGARSPVEAESKASWRRISPTDLPADRARWRRCRRRNQRVRDGGARKLADDYHVLTQQNPDEPGKLTCSTARSELTRRLTSRKGGAGFEWLRLTRQAAEDRGGQPPRPQARKVNVKNRLRDRPTRIWRSRRPTSRLTRRTSSRRRTRVRRADLKSPVTEYVTRSKRHHVGAVVQPGGRLMEIVAVEDRCWSKAASARGHASFARSRTPTWG